MKQMFGWVQSSDTASIYVHLSGRDVDDALLKLNGVAVEEERHDKSFSVTICPRCKSKNSLGSKFCITCGLALEGSVAMEIDEARAKLDRLFNKLTEDSRTLDKLLSLIESA